MSPAKHESLNRKQQRLDAQDQCMHEADGVDRMKGEAVHFAEISRFDQVVVAGVGIGDAATAGRHPVQPALVERLEKDKDRSRLPDLLCLDQLLPPRIWPAAM